MTLYARGYREYTDGFASRRLRFGPIFIEGYRNAIRGKAFRRFGLLFILILIVFSMVYYLNPVAFMSRAIREGGSGSDVVSRAETLRSTVAEYLATLDWLSPLLVLFVGAGLVADDLRTRALPLYLVRPITPTDYWLGKWLIPAGVLALAFLLPSVLLVLFGVLLEPSDHVLAFAGAQGPLVLGVFCSYLAASAAYGGLVLIVSTLTGRRTPALILGAAYFAVSPVIMGLALGAARAGRDGDVASSGLLDIVRSLVLPNDASAIFHSIAGLPLDAHDRMILPPVGTAIGMVVTMFFLCAIVVIRRARTVEVVS